MFRIEQSTEIFSRKDFAKLCNARKLYKAVEIGTHHGAFASDFLEIWNGEILYCVDQYASYDDMPWDRSADYLMAVNRLSRYVPRVQIIRASSEQAAEILRNRIIEFVYIDAAHDYDSVKKDILLWWDRIYPGETILAGHDYDSEHAGVMRAVDEFARYHDLTVRLTREGDSPPSWYIYRQEPQTLCRFAADL